MGKSFRQGVQFLVDEVRGKNRERKALARERYFIEQEEKRQREEEARQAAQKQAEEAAVDQAIKGRERQERKRKSKGRDSTILASSAAKKKASDTIAAGELETSLGEVGGDSGSGRKTLLGL